MIELKDDSSDSDVFIVNQIRPAKNRKLKQTLITKSVLRSTQPTEDTARANAGKLSTRLKCKEKRQNLTVISNCPNVDILKTREVKQKNKISHLSSGNEISESSLEIYCDKNKSDGIKRNSSGNELLCPLEEPKSEELLGNMNIKSLLMGTKAGEAHLVEKQKSDDCKIKKRVDSSPEFSENTKRFKNYSITPLRCLPTNKLIKKPSSEMSVKVFGRNSSKRKKTEGNIILDIENEDDSNKIKFGELQTNEVEDKFDKMLNSSSQNQEEKYKGNSELLCIFLKKIISDEIKKDVEIKEKSARAGKAVQNLLSEYEIGIFERFMDLEDKASKLFVRILIRKHEWYRISTIIYNDIDENLGKYFKILENVNFIDINIEDEDFNTQLNLLRKPEILELCKAFNSCYKSQNGSKKNILIKSLIEDCKKQKSVLDIIKGNNSYSRVDLLKSQIKKYLGMCIKINQRTFSAFNKISLLSSFAHYFDEEEKRLSSMLYMCLKIHKNVIIFPKYKLSPSVVFETKGDFEEYEASLRLLNTFEVAISNKNYDEFIAVVTEVKKCFQNVLNNYEYQKRFLSLPSFLQKFSAGTIYARILTKYCQVFKRRADDLDIVETVKLLLHQNLFLQRKRGNWYEILSKALENKKENNAAAEVIITSLNDPLINDVQKLTLQLRGQGILRKKTFGVTDLHLKEVLTDKCLVSLEEPISIEIRGRVLDGSESGFKCVYIQDLNYGKKYASVEERAISYYKSHGFSKGYHVEGSLIHTIYFIMFFDIIYGLSPEGVFQSPYQEAPLDFNSTSFYLNRKEEIDKLLADMPAWDYVKIETTIKDVYSRNQNTMCIINWNNEFTPELFCEVIKCITMPTLVLIFQRLLHNFRVYRSGFPDLTLWNPETNEIKFVEVKSPNDRLSPAQRIWLNYLRHIGLNSEVCNVKRMKLVRHDTSRYSDCALQRFRPRFVQVELAHNQMVVGLYFLFDFLSPSNQSFYEALKIGTNYPEDSSGKNCTN